MDSMFYGNPNHGYLVDRLCYFPSFVQQKKVLCNHVNSQWMYFMQACCFQLAVYHILLPSKPSGSHLIRWSTLISTGKKMMICHDSNTV